jgi:hypothetical protein
MYPSLLLLVPLLLCPLSGCCSLARFFCGPDKTPWVSQRFDTPQRTVQTLFEAVRRDEPQAAFLCLGDGYRRRLGLDSMTLQLAWERLREKNPGLHMAGYVDVPPGQSRDPDHASVTVDVAGTPVDIDLERQAYWEVAYRRDNGTLGEEGAAIASFSGCAVIETAPAGRKETSRLLLEPMNFHHEGIDAVPLSAIEHATLTRRWRITDIRQRKARSVRKLSQVSSRGNRPLRGRP